MAVRPLKMSRLLIYCVLSSLTSQRPEPSVGYKQKEFLRAAKVIIVSALWW